MTREHERLREARQGKKWRRWGPYLSERQWGTVREDYSEGGHAWNYFPHEHARSRAYRWGEDGLLGWCDNRGLVHFALALWNGEDPFLKERLFGLTGHEGNHGEDVKEVYHYLDATPTYSYAKALYRYPYGRFPYERLREDAARAGRHARETSLADTGVFECNRFFDVLFEMAKGDVDDVLVRVTLHNRGPEARSLVVIPTLWFRNVWGWDPAFPDEERPLLTLDGRSIAASDKHLGRMRLHFEGDCVPLFTENETNRSRLYGIENVSPYVKDAFHRFVVQGEGQAVNPAMKGTKGGLLYRVELPPGGARSLRFRYTRGEAHWAEFEDTFRARKDEADAFFQAVIPTALTREEANVFRQAIAGLLFTKQYYHLDVHRWLKGDPGHPKPPRARKLGRNAAWTHLYNSEVLSIPDKWEYPWYAAWDLAFHCIPLALVDPDFSKEQLMLLLREWYMHPNGQLPAYEWAFGDVNPPVHAWASQRVFQMEARHHGAPDIHFLESVFHKLMLNFTWWVNRKDARGKNVFEGGFLGLDNIGVFDRSSALPEGGYIEQADATSWMGMYCLDLLTVSLTLASMNKSYQDVANKFFEHFLLIAHAMNHKPKRGTSLWDEEDGFYYDHLRLSDGTSIPMKVRSMVGLIPLFAVQTVDAETLRLFPAFLKRVRWFLKNRPDLAPMVASVEDEGVEERHLLAILGRERLVRVLSKMLDESEFLSPYGIRSLSRYHKDHPYELSLFGNKYRVEYEPAESQSGLFGGNSNWRGPVWFPVNYLIIESLQKYHHYYGDSLRVECPTGSGRMMNLWEVAEELSRRLLSLFLPGEDGVRPALRGFKGPLDDGMLLFHEYFHADTGEGLGAAHQTGWTALVAKLLHQRRLRKDPSVR